MWRPLYDQHRPLVEIDAASPASLLQAPMLDEADSREHRDTPCPKTAGTALRDLSWIARRSRPCGILASSSKLDGPSAWRRRRRHRHHEQRHPPPGARQRVSSQRNGVQQDAWGAWIIPCSSRWAPTDSQQYSCIVRPPSTQDGAAHGCLNLEIALYLGRRAMPPDRGGGRGGTYPPLTPPKQAPQANNPGRRRQLSSRRSPKTPAAPNAPNTGSAALSSRARGKASHGRVFCGLGIDSSTSAVHRAIIAAARTNVGSDGATPSKLAPARTSRLATVSTQAQPKAPRRPFPDGSRDHLERELRRRCGGGPSGGMQLGAQHRPNATCRGVQRDRPEDERHSGGTMMTLSWLVGRGGMGLSVRSLLTPCGGSTGLALSLLADADTHGPGAAKLPGRGCPHGHDDHSRDRPGHPPLPRWRRADIIPDPSKPWQRPRHSKKTPSAAEDGKGYKGE